MLKAKIESTYSLYSLVLATNYTSANCKSVDDIYTSILATPILSSLLEPLLEEISCKEKYI